ncbi:MAG TPA: N-acetylmuramoyl-L-alanine amidase [bacterium]|nr:N-acetylmuramoyl-L-alanine amidase [bacterium]
MKRKETYIVIIFLCFFGNVHSAAGQTITVVHADGSVRAGLKTTSSLHNLRYLSIQEFTSLFNTPAHYDQQQRKYFFHLNNKKIRLSPFNPFISIEKKIYQLPAETVLISDELYVPAIFFLEIISSEFSDHIVYDRLSDNLLVLSPIYGNTPNIQRVEIEEKTNGTLIKIFTIKDFDESNLSLRARHHWLYLDVYGGKVDSAKTYAEYPAGMVARVVTSQLSNELAQIGFRVRDEIIEKQVYLQSPRLIFLTVKTQKDLSQEIRVNIENEKKKWLIDLIVIDPGHGGKDPGTIGVSGVYEKNIVLPISKYLKEYLETELKINVLMTRETDKFIPLQKRTEFANRHGAKLFLSIHANHNHNRRLRGVSAYFLGLDMTDEAREVARLENSVIKYEEKSKYSEMSWEQYILSAGAQSLYNKESEDLAGMIQENIIQQCKLQDRRVRQANFYVLWGASMPAVLVETAFISNPQDERLLKDRSFQKKIAYSIFLSIKQFKEKYESAF